MDGFELREEIDHGGSKYFLQTSFLPKEGCIQSSFFKDGVLFDTVTRPLSKEESSTGAREMTKDAHLLSRKKFQFLLDARDRVKTSKDPIHHLKLAQALFRKNLFTEAVQEAEKALLTGRSDSRPYIVIGDSYFRMGEFGKAFEAVEKGIEINPEYPDLHNLMGLIFLKQKKCRQAIERFQHAIGLNLYYGEPYLNLARAFLLNSVIKEDYELSRDLESTFMSNLERAAQLNPMIRGESIEEARRLFEEQKYEEALDLLDGFNKRAARTGVEDIILELYLMLLKSGEDLREEDIESYLDRVRVIIDQNPTYADGYNSLGILYTAKCKILMDRASEAFTKALEINKSYRRAHKNLRLAENDRQGIFILLKALLD